NFGIETCWLNVHQQPKPEGIDAHYEVRSLHELKEILIA
ncbi:pyrimidine 5'-nucleotidase, partial [Vibrio furnissii]